MLMGIIIIVIMETIRELIQQPLTVLIKQIGRR